MLTSVRNAAPAQNGDSTERGDRSKVYTVHAVQSCTAMKITHLTRLPSQIDRSLAFLDFRGAHMSERTVPWLWTSAGKTKKVC